MRPVQEADLEHVLALSFHTAFGLTTLPRNERLLSRRIRRSVESFARIDDEPEPGDEYFFVLEERPSGRVVGTSAIFSKVGGYQPFYAYRIETSVHASETLGVRKEVRALHLHTEHDGPTEIGTLFLHPDARRGGAGRLLSLGRFLLIAEHPQAFDARVIAEMRGVIDDEGRSVFWEAVGRHFFDVDLSVADTLSIADKRFIADLMPEHPIYLPILPPEVQAVVGKVHPLTEPALHLLQDEGFRDAGMVDIFEAGPVVQCPRDEIRSVRQSRVDPIVAIGVAPDDADRDAVERVIARCDGFRATKGVLGIAEEGITLDAALAEALEVGVGDRLRHAPIRADANERPKPAAEAT